MIGQRERCVLMYRAGFCVSVSGKRHEDARDTVLKSIQPVRRRTTDDHTVTFCYNRLECVWILTINTIFIFI